MRRAQPPPAAGRAPAVPLLPANASREWNAAWRRDGPGCERHGVLHDHSTIGRTDGCAFRDRCVRRRQLPGRRERPRHPRRHVLLRRPSHPNRQQTTVHIRGPQPRRDPPIEGSRVVHRWHAHPDHQLPVPGMRAIRAIRSAGHRVSAARSMATIGAQRSTLIDSDVRARPPSDRHRSAWGLRDCRQPAPLRFSVADRQAHAEALCTHTL